MSALLVTGTDTGVGKTFVACALATALRERGRRVAVMKPVETGVEGKPTDALALRAAAADPAPLGDICPYRLRAPLAPAVAARLEGVTIDVTRLVTRYFATAAPTAGPAARSVALPASSARQPVRRTTTRSGSKPRATVLA